MRVPVLRPAGLAAGAVVLALAGTSAAGAAPGGHARAAQRAPQAAARSAGQDGSRSIGRWSVAAVAPGSYRLTWHSPTLIPITDAQVQVRHARSVVAAAVGPQGRTVSVVVPSATPPDPSTYDVVLGARVLDAREGERKAGPDRTPYRAPSARTLLSDPG